jgi:serine protease inhibitor
MSDSKVAGMPRRALLQGALGLLAVASLPSVVGCASSPHPPDSPGGTGLHSLAADVSRERASLDSIPDLAAVVAGIRNFGVALHRATATVNDNWTVSPLSLGMAFGMLRAGSRGATAHEVDSVFGFPTGPRADGSPHHALNALGAHLVTTTPVATAPSPTPSGKIAPDPIVAIANGLFLDQAFADRINETFLRTLAAQYGASPTAVRFADPSVAAAINAWVTRQTRGRIEKLFDSIDPSTVLVLANAVYLKTTWLNQFRAETTADGPFTTRGGHRVTARMMRQQLPSVPYSATSQWQRVVLPYVGGELTMRVVVPAADDADMTALGEMLAAATQPKPPDRRAWVDLTLPRWDTATNLPLVSALARLGMPDAFTNKADLSGIAPGLFVNDAIHRANITVDEHGTEAAAVTGIGMATSARIGTPIVMQADRPFAWAVVHEPSGTPVFTGHVVDPTGGHR